MSQVQDDIDRLAAAAWPNHQYALRLCGVSINDDTKYGFLTGFRAGYQARAGARHQMTPDEYRRELQGDWSNVEKDRADERRIRDA